MRAFGLPVLAPCFMVVALAGCKRAPQVRDEVSPPESGRSPSRDTSEGTTPTSSPGTRGFRDVVPSQVWPDVPARVVGLLYQRGSQPWGEALHHTGAFVSGHDLERREYTFSTEGSSPYALYFISPDRVGLHHISRWQVSTPGGATHFDAAMFDASTPNNWGLHDAAHIVEIDVNAGAGGRGLHFVATDLRVLDGVDGVPANPTELLVAVRQRFDPLVEANRAELDAVHAASSKRAQAQADQKAVRVRNGNLQATVENEEDHEQVGLAPTWRVDTLELAVIIVYHRVGSVIVHTQRPRSTGGVDHGPEHSEAEFGFGVRLGARYVVSAEGEVALEEVLKIEDAAWTTEG